jgi:hypothetical protein
MLDVGATPRFVEHLPRCPQPTPHRFSQSGPCDEILRARRVTVRGQEFERDLSEIGKRIVDRRRDNGCRHRN